jgi:hypothetical protein
MSRRVSEHPEVVNDFGEFGRAFVETDIAEADRETVIRNFVSGWVAKKKAPAWPGLLERERAGGWGDDGSHSLSSTPNVAKKFGRTLSRILTGPLAA